MRPRPGREYSAEYGSWLILICCTADALTLSALTSMPLTTMVTPPLPSDPASRKRDIVATIVVIEDRQAFEHVLVDGHGVDVARGAGLDLGRPRC